MLSSAQPHYEPAETAIPADNAQGAEENCLILGQNGQGLWVVRDRLGLKAGIFASFEAAHHFAKEEAAAAHSRIILSPAALELGLDL
ncbi:MAG: hypothetical protein ACLPPF_08500 [Rhodomicrobium sp.]